MGLSYHSNRKRCRIRMIVSLVLKHFSHNFSQPIRLFPILADSFDEGIANPQFEAVGLQIRRNYKKYK